MFLFISLKICPGWYKQTEIGMNIPRSMETLVWVSLPCVKATTRWQQRPQLDRSIAVDDVSSWSCTRDRGPDVFLDDASGGHLLRSLAVYELFCFLPRFSTMMNFQDLWFISLPRHSAEAKKKKNHNQGDNEIGLQFYIQNATCFNALEHMQREIVSLSSLCSLKQSSHFDREGGKTVWYLEDQQKLLVQKKTKQCHFTGWRARRRKELPNVTFLESQSRQSSPLHPTLALMMVGLGSKMPCIFLKAGMTKRLQVTTADTGFPGTKRWTQRGRWGEGGRKKKETTMSNISAGASAWIPLSLNFTHYLGGQRLVCEHRPCPRWQMLWGDCKWQKKTLGEYQGRPPNCEY